LGEENPYLERERFEKRHPEVIERESENRTMRGRGLKICSYPEILP
jgi:hypothetical protein